MRNLQDNLVSKSQKQGGGKNSSLDLKKLGATQKLATNKGVSVTDIFKGVSFCFPHLDAVLSGKLVQIFKEQIKANGGAIFEVGRLWLTSKRYYLVSEKASLVKLKKFLEELDGLVLHYSYIKECIASKTLLPTDKFRISAPMLQSAQKLEFKRQLQSIHSEKSHNQEKMKCIQTKLEEKGFKVKAVQEEKQRNVGLLKELAEGTKTTMENSMSHVLGSDTSSKTIPIEDDNQNQIEKFKRPRPFADDSEIKEKQMPRKILKKNQTESPKKQMDIQSDADNGSAEKKYWDDKKQEFVSSIISLSSMPLNAFICQELTKLQKIYQVEKDKGRAIAYTKAVAAVKSLKTDIRQKSDLANLRGIGPKIMDKIMELIETGKMSKLQKFQKDQKYEAINKLCEVWGIGPATARDLYSRNIKTIEDLRKNDNLLTKNQKMGLKYFQEFKQKIPRSEIEKIEAIVKDTIYNMVGSSSTHIIETCGSYRRGKDFCGDIDIIIARKDGTFEKDLIFNLYQNLKDIGLITDHLSLPRLNHEHESFSYMGVCQLDGGIHRRIDIKYYPISEFAYALMHFTGSDMFNRAIRLVAHQQGYRLSDHSMVPLDSDDKNKGKKNIVCYTEADIFKFLGLDYKAPKDRNS